jgi:hypothetical protein
MAIPSVEPKRGDIREDGMVFLCLRKSGSERWVTKEQFEELRIKGNQSCKRYAIKNPDKIYQRNKRYYENNREREIERAKLQYRENPELSREKLLKRRFGITFKKYDEMLKSQNGVCAICQSSCRSGKNLSVDHCHKTGKVRGLLCVDCNLGIANLKESQEIFKKAAEYVEKFQNISH